jgi:protease I
MKKILTVIDDLAEDLELLYPYYRMMEEGYQVDMAAPYTSTHSYDEIDVNNYDGLLIPGGWAPDKIRRYETVLDIVRKFDEQKKPIGQICHAGWVTISAGILKGRKVTSTPGIKDDMMNAGGIWSNEAVVVDENLVSSRWPKDLPEYMKAFIEALKK